MDKEDLKNLHDALYKSFSGAIDELGIEFLRQCSFFGTNVDPLEDHHVTDHG